MIGHTPSATGTHSSNRSFSPESDNSLGSVLDDSGDSSPEQQGVFMTQVSVVIPQGVAYRHTFCMCHAVYKGSLFTESVFCLVHKVFHIQDVYVVAPLSLRLMVMDQTSPPSLWRMGPPRLAQ